MSLKDETIKEKIKVFNLDSDKNVYTCKKDKKENKNVFGQYDEFLTNALRLKTTNRIQLGLTYQKAKKILKNYNLHSKEDYYNLCKNDTRLPQDPEEMFGKTFLGWFDYLGIEMQDYYYKIYEFREKINQYVKKNNIYEIKDLEIICKLDSKYPPYELWTEYYKVNSVLELINLCSRKTHKK